MTKSWKDGSSHFPLNHGRKRQIPVWCEAKVDQQIFVLLLYSYIELLQETSSWSNVARFNPWHQSIKVCLYWVDDRKQYYQTSDLFLFCLLAWCHELVCSPLNCSCLLMLQTMWVSLDEAGPCIAIDEEGSITMFQSILQQYRSVFRFPVVLLRIRDSNIRRSLVSTFNCFSARRSTVSPEKTNPKFDKGEVKQRQVDGKFTMFTWDLGFSAKKVVV